MKKEKEKYPIFRKYTGIAVWFRIDGFNQFTEIKKIGENYLQNNIIAIQFPELQFIKDMVNCFEGRWEIISENDYSNVQKRIKKV